MKQAASTSAPACLPQSGPWLVAAAVVLPTFMEILDTTIAIVALRHIAGGLSAPVHDSEWAITSYLAANAVVLPLSGWLSTRLGRRRFLLLCIALFTVSSTLCGMASSLEQLILFRVLQGLAGGGLQPCSQGILLDAFPPSRQGSAMTLFGLAALTAPVVGPILGGWITDNYDWRWVFYINLPIGALAFVACAALVEDPAYLRQQTAEYRRQARNFDFLGLGLLVCGAVAWETLLSKGQEWDWFDDPWWRVHALAALCLLALAGFVVQETRHSCPIVNLKPLRERNFTLACVIIFCCYGVLYAMATSVPQMLQALFGYDAFSSGLVMSPAGLFSILVFPCVAFLLGRGADARWLISIGIILMAGGTWWASRMNIQVSPWHLVAQRVVMVVGLAMIFAPINVAAYRYTPLALRGAAVGLFSLIRNEGGSFGTSLAKTLHERREQFHTARLGEFLDPLNPSVTGYIDQARAVLYQISGDPVLSFQLAWHRLGSFREQQASSFAYFDCFWGLSIVCIGLLCFVPCMKRSVADKSDHLSAD